MHLSIVYPEYSSHCLFKTKIRKGLSGVGGGGVGGTARTNLTDNWPVCRAGVESNLGNLCYWTAKNLPALPPGQGGGGGSNSGLLVLQTGNNCCQKKEELL